MAPFSRDVFPRFGSIVVVRKLVAWSVLLAACGTGTLARAQSEGTLDVTALKKLSLEELLNVEVTSVARRPEKLSETPSAIQVITGDEITRSTATNLPEALRLADNLDVAQRNSHDWNIAARGFNTDLTNKMLVMIDGRTVYSPLFSGVFWDAQDYLLKDIDRIEVVSGPGGTVWGANAVNGVINVVTKSADETQGLLAEGAGGNELRTLAGLRYGGTLRPGVYYRVYGKYTDRGPDQYADGSDATDAWSMARAGFRLDAESVPNQTFTLQGDYYNGTEDIPTGKTSRLSGRNVLTRWLDTTSPDSDIRLQLYHDRTHIELPKPSNGLRPAGSLADDLDTYDLDFQHYLRFRSRQQLVWGVGYRFMRDAFMDAPTVALVPARLSQELFSGFAQDEISIGERFTATVGSKVEHNSYTGFEVEPSIRIRRKMTAGQMAWAAVSRAVRTPSRVDRDLIQPTGLSAPFPPSVLTGSEDFRSETVVAYEAGDRAQFGSKVSASLAIFYNDYDHVRSITPGPAAPPNFGLPLVLANNVQGETHGAEFSADVAVLPWWRIGFGANLLREHLHVAAGKKDFSNALNEVADPRHQVMLRSSMDLPGNLQIDGALRWVDIRHTSNGPTPGTVPSYAEFDLRMRCQLSEHLEFSLVGQNLLHARHFEYGYPSPSREEIVRSIYAEATWNY